MHTTLRTARAAYYAANGFPADGGYSSAWVRLRAGPLTIAFPNFAVRARMIRHHDLHHLLTGYRMDVAGEIELCAWEMAAGYNGVVPGWQLNSSGVAAGALVMPRRTWRAFVRGRRSRSLYGIPFDDLLDRDVEDARRCLDRHTGDARVRASDIVRFGTTVSAGLVVMLVALPLALLLLPLGMLAAWRTDGA